MCSVEADRVRAESNSSPARCWHTLSERARQTRHWGAPPAASTSALFPVHTGNSLEDLFSQLDTEDTVRPVFLKVESVFTVSVRLASDWASLVRCLWVQTWRDVGAFLQPPVPIASQLPPSVGAGAAHDPAAGASASSTSGNVQLASWPSSTRASVALSRFLARSFDSHHVLFLPPPGSTVRRVERELACTHYDYAHARASFLLFFTLRPRFHSVQCYFCTTTVLYMYIVQESMSYCSVDSTSRCTVLVHVLRKRKLYSCSSPVVPNQSSVRSPHSALMSADAFAAGSDSGAAGGASSSSLEAHQQQQAEQTGGASKRTRRAGSGAADEEATARTTGDEEQPKPEVSSLHNPYLKQPRAPS